MKDQATAGSEKFGTGRGCLIRRHAGAWLLIDRDPCATQNLGASRRVFGTVCLRRYRRLPSVGRPPDTVRTLLRAGFFFAFFAFVPSSLLLSAASARLSPTFAAMNTFAVRTSEAGHFVPEGRWCTGSRFPASVTTVVHSGHAKTRVMVALLREVPIATSMRTRRGLGKRCLQSSRAAALNPLAMKRQGEAHGAFAHSLALSAPVPADSASVVLASSGSGSPGSPRAPSINLRLCVSWPSMHFA